jgi:RND family efflux transporter MFP subunit
MKRLFRFILPPLVLLAGLAIATGLIATGPKTERQRPKTVPPTVEILELQPQSYQVEVSSRGTVSPRTRSTLVPEVSGKIVWVAEGFRDGGFIEKNSPLLRIDQRDYQNALTIARSELSQRKLDLAQEQARSAQARLDWEKLQLEGEPTPLLLRRPQMENAEAALAAAEARLRQAELDLERTTIKAPYAGRILDKKVDLGQYVSPGTPLAEIFASDTVEVRLPISSEQQSYLQLPEDFLNEDDSKPDGAEVLFTARVGNHTYRWNGRLVRTEGTVDIRSRQLFVIAQIEDPYLRQGDRPPLKIGQFLEARIQGEKLRGVFVIPRQAVRGEQTVHLVDADNHLQRRNLQILWRDEQQVVTSGPLSAGERLSLTALPFAAEGIEVRIAGQASPDAAAQQPGQGR